MSQKTISRGISVVTALALLALLGLTIVAAQVNLGPLGVPVALAIAAAKAALVAAYFMHLRVDRPITRIFALAAVIWLLILIIGTANDIVTRDWMRPGVDLPPYRVE